MKVVYILITGTEIRGVFESSQDARNEALRVLDNLRPESVNDKFGNTFIRYPRKTFKIKKVEVFPSTK